MPGFIPRPASFELAAMVSTQAGLANRDVVHAGMGSTMEALHEGRLSAATKKLGLDSLDNDFMASWLFSASYISVKWWPSDKFTKSLKLNEKHIVMQLSLTYEVFKMHGIP